MCSLAQAWREWDTHVYVEKAVDWPSKCHKNKNYRIISQRTSGKMSEYKLVRIKIQSRKEIYPSALSGWLTLLKQMIPLSSPSSSLMFTHLFFSPFIPVSISTFKQAIYSNVMHHGQPWRHTTFLSYLHHMHLHFCKIEDVLSVHVTFLWNM